jgi:hypothetical protein
MTFWRLLNVELWLRRYIDADDAARSWTGTGSAGSTATTGATG